MAVNVEVLFLKDIRMRISVLWIFFAVMMSAHYAMYLFEPGAIARVISGEMVLWPELAFAESLINWLIPLTMAFLSITLKDEFNKKANLALGAVFTIYGILHIVSCPIAHVFDNPAVHQVLISASTIVVTAIIAWYAYKWTKVEE